MSSQPTIAVFTKNRLNPAYALARAAAERTATRLGARVIQYVPEKPDNVEQQIELIGVAITSAPPAMPVMSAM